MGWGITDIIHTLRDLWLKSKIDHIELKLIQIGVWKYCSNKQFSLIRRMCGNMTVISYINNKDVIRSDSCNKIAWGNYGYQWLISQISLIRKLISRLRSLMMSQTGNFERSVKADPDLFIRVPVNSYISMFDRISQQEQFF